MDLVLKWIDKHGGLDGMAVRNQQKADILYKVIDSSEGFYKGLVHKDSRSTMNITFSAANPENERKSF
ncbi:Phosphoserine aminotransferase [compost metagenome]